MSNYSENKKAIDAFRKELKAMLDDIREIDVKVLNKAVNVGVRIAKENTQVITGFMRRSWKPTPTVKNKSGVEKGIVNTADYASFVNYGHRQQVGRYVPAIGKRLKKPWVEGQYMLEKAINHTEKTMVKEFKKEVEGVNRKHDK